MTTTPDRLYVELMKKTLAFAFWPEPLVPIDSLSHQRPPFKRWLVSCISRILERRQLKLARQPQYTLVERQSGEIWPGYAHTMIGLERLNNLQFCVETVLREGIAGDLIETGVWRGGACIFMRAILAAHGVKDRRVFVADSFEGLPKPDPERFPADAGDLHHIHTSLAVSQDEVESNFRKFDLLDEQVVFLKGWFEDTLPNAPIERLAVLRLDGDMYASTFEALKSLYPKLSRSGFCIVDDYALKGCKKAVDDFRSQNRIVSELKQIDWTGTYWRKEE